MKDDRYTGTICRKACSFYKPGREALRCGGYTFLTRHFTENELDGIDIPQSAHSPLTGYVHFRHAEIEAQLCGICDFRDDGCDFAENCSGPPCGGYRIAHHVWCL